MIILGISVSSESFDRLKANTPVIIFPLSGSSTTVPSVVSSVSCIGIKDLTGLSCERAFLRLSGSINAFTSITPRTVSARMGAITELVAPIVMYGAESFTMTTSSWPV